MLLKFDPTCLAFVDMEVMCPSTGKAAALFVGHLLF